MNTGTEIETKELSVLKGQVSKLEKRANEVTIATQEENASATELKAQLKGIGRTIKERKEAITKPLNEALKSARELFAPLELQFESADRIIGHKLLAYKHKVDTEALVKEAAIAARVEKGTMKLETAEKKMEQLERVDKTIKTNHGQVQFRLIPKVRIIDESLIPDEYWIIDHVSLRRDVLSGISVPGTEKYEEEIV